MKDLMRQSGLDLRLDEERLALDFGPNIAHPAGEVRTIAQVRPMLEDPHAEGPEHLYTVYMDIYEEKDQRALQQQDLLYGSVVYNSGVLGSERLRSQGHIHSEKPGTGLRYSEVYEFWTGQGFVYLQKECAPDVSRIFLVKVGPGDKLVIPFGWVHLVITQGTDPLSFGAWCARANVLEYAPLRQLGGPAYFPHADGTFRKNPHYRVVPEVEYVELSDFPTLQIPQDRPIYTSWQQAPELYTFMTRPEILGDIWKDL